MKTNTHNSFPLLVREWLALILLVGLIVGLALLTSIRSMYFKRNTESLFVGRKEFIEVFVKGAVEHPGVYQIPKTLILKELLDTAGVKAEADLRRFNLNKTLRNGRMINLKARPMITISVKGAVKIPGLFAVPKGSRLEELMKILPLEENADLSSLQKKRRIKEGESISIPTR